MSEENLCHDTKQITLCKSLNITPSAFSSTLKAIKFNGKNLYHYLTGISEENHYAGVTVLGVLQVLK
ncbi:MAG: hypothetical protein IPL16_12665 [Ignavibacteria bacterium]|nr:hypothetical protein [Ignavibacteria bacterium]